MGDDIKVVRISYSIPAAHPDFLADFESRFPVEFICQNDSRMMMMALAMQRLLLPSGDSEGLW
jgi:predicted NBD/HSP70 family sugar kinase